MSASSWNEDQVSKYLRDHNHVHMVKEEAVAKLAEEEVQPNGLQIASTECPVQVNGSVLLQLNPEHLSVAPYCLKGGSITSIMTAIQLLTATGTPLEDQFSAFLHDLGLNASVVSMMSDHPNKAKVNRGCRRGCCRASRLSRQKTCMALLRFVMALLS